MEEHSNILAGGTPNTKKTEYWFPKEIPWMSSGEINKKVLWGTDNKISQLGLDNSSARWVKQNSVLIALAGQGKTRGMVAINKIPLTTNQSIAAIELDDRLETNFVFQNLEKRYDELRLISSGDGTRGGLNKQIISDIYIIAPNLPEQQKIGQFFQTLDTLIAGQKRKVALLKKLKKSWLQRIFEQKVRVEGFTGEWKISRLKNISERVTRKNRNLESKILLTISAQMGLVDQREYFDKQIASRDTSNYLLLQKGEFAYNKSYSNGYPWGAIKRLDRYDNGVLSTLYIAFKAKNIDSDFLAQYYETDKWYQEVAACSAEGARNHGLLNISANDFFEMKLEVPISKEEQQKIGKFFQSLDHKITQADTKLSAMTVLKTAYLQKMFV